MRRFVLCVVALALIGGTSFAGGPVHRDAVDRPMVPTKPSTMNTFDLSWVKVASQADVQEAIDKLAYGVQNRPAVMLETEYYVYPYTDVSDNEVTTPSLMLSLDSNGYAQPVTMYLYWQDRDKGGRRYIANGGLLAEGVVQDIFGTSGTPIWTPNLDSFFFFGPQSAWGDGPANDT